MKKLHLNLDDLRIDSFKPAVRGDKRDVVAQATCPETDTCPTCDHTNLDNGYTCSICTTSCQAIC